MCQPERNRRSDWSFDCAQDRQGRHPSAGSGQAPAGPYNDSDVGTTPCGCPVGEGRHPSTALRAGSGLALQPVMPGSSGIQRLCCSLSSFCHPRQLYVGDPVSLLFSFFAGFNAPGFTRLKVLLGIDRRTQRSLAPGRGPVGFLCPSRRLSRAAELASLRQSSPPNRIVETGAQPRPKAPVHGSCSCCHARLDRGSRVVAFFVILDISNRGSRVFAFLFLCEN